MFRKPSIKNSLQSICKDSSVQELFVELDEENEESLSGGAQFIPLIIFYNQQNSSTGGFRFPCDGPGRGGTC
jgi:hypothetical protein